MRLSELTTFELRGEWRRLHRMPPPILVCADGIEWRGQRYRSLSVVARKITGARWSGPRFFGLRRQLDSHSVIAAYRAHSACVAEFRLPTGGAFRK